MRNHLEGGWKMAVEDRCMPNRGGRLGRMDCIKVYHTLELQFAFCDVATMVIYLYRRWKYVHTLSQLEWSLRLCSLIIVAVCYRTHFKDTDVDWQCSIDLPKRMFISQRDYDRYVTHIPAIIIWAPSWENLFLPYANNKGADQPALPRSPISAFVVRCLSIISLVSIFEISWLWLASVAQQTDLSLTWSQTGRQVFSWRGSYVPPVVTMCVFWSEIKNRTYWLNRVIGSYCEIEKTFSLILVRFNEKKICSHLNIWQLHFLKSIARLQLPGLNSGNVNLTHVLRNIFMPYARKIQISLRIHSLCHSRSRQYNTYSCYIRKFRTTVSFCSWADRFEPYMYLVAHFRKQSFLIPWLMI